MAKNKIITSQGNVQFINSKGKTINMHPMHCYAVYQDDTVSFLFIYMKEYSGQAFFASQFEDLEVDGAAYDSIDALKEAIAEAFAKAGAQARTEIVDELPETGYTNTIYLVKKEHGEGYDEYIYNEEKGWQLLGDTDIEFERYLKIDDFNPYSAATKDYIDAVSGETVANHNDIVALSGAIDTEISARTDADAVISGAVDTLSANLANEVQRAQGAEQTLQNNINTVNSRVDAEQVARASADNAISGAVDTLSAALTEDERVWGEALNDLNSRINTVSGDVANKVDTSVYNTYTADTQTAINAKANSADVYNKSQVYTKSEVDELIADIDLSEIEDRITEDEEVTASGLNALNDKFGGLKLMKISQSDYDNLQVKDNNTLYIISD